MTEPMNSSTSVKAMLLTSQLHDLSAGGCELLCKLNHVVLQETYGERFALFELPCRPLQGIRSILSAIKRRSG